MHQPLLPEFFSRLQFFATRPQTVQRDEVLGIAFATYGARTVSMPDRDCQRIIYTEKSDAEHLYKTINKKLTTSEGWKAHLQAYEDLKKQFETVRVEAEVIESDDTQQAKKAYLSWVKACEQFVDFILGPFIVERDLDPLCHALVKKEYGEEAERVWGIITSPSELHEFQKMRLEIVEAALRRDASEKTCQKLAEHFGWYNEYSYVEPLLNAAHFTEEIQKLSFEEARAEKDKILHETQENKEAFESFLATCQNAELKHLATVIHTYTFLRTDRVDQMKKTQVPLRRAFDVIAKEAERRTGQSWTREMVVACTRDELLDIVDTGTIPNAQNLQDRAQQKYVYYSEGGKAYVLHGDDCIREARALIEQGQSQSQVIKGRIAFPGKVRGRVSVVFNKTDLPNVQPGDVLVAKTTMPDYTPAMKIAAAFVTEEGGVTSHAAIIARELKKPCIVGTGNCTKLLQNGDMVEVDAETGEVTIL